MENSGSTRIQLRDLSSQIRDLTEKVSIIGGEGKLTQYQVQELTKDVSELKKMTDTLASSEASQKGQSEQTQFILKHGISILGFVMLVISIVLGWLHK